MLVRCLYASRATTPLDEAALDEILRQSRTNNALRGVTGLLCLANKIFVQALEGGRSEISRLLASIIRDPRHSGVELLLFEEIAERQFGGWTMGRVKVADVNQALVLKYSESPAFDPFACSGATTLKLLTELSAEGAIVSRSR